MSDSASQATRNTSNGGQPRGPLWAVILAKTGADIRRCMQCWRCEGDLRPGMDMTFGEILQAAARDSPRALDNRTIWTYKESLPAEAKCPSGLDVGEILQVLQEEARLRGLKPGRRA